jgi:hypothetical protein
MDASMTNNSHAKALKRTDEIAAWIAQIAITEPQSCCENERIELRYRMDALFGHDRPRQLRLSPGRWVRHIRYEIEPEGITESPRVCMGALFCCLQASTVALPICLCVIRLYEIQLYTI